MAYGRHGLLLTTQMPGTSGELRIELHRPRTPSEERKLKRGKITIGVRKDRHSVVTSNGDDPHVEDDRNREMDDDQPVRDMLPPATVPNVGRVHN